MAVLHCHPWRRQCKVQHLPKTDQDGSKQVKLRIKMNMHTKPIIGALLVFSTIQRGCTQKSGRIDQEVRERPIERWIRGVPPPPAANHLPEVPPGIRIREAKPGGNHQDLREKWVILYKGIPLIILITVIRYFTESETGDEATCSLCTAQVWHLKEYVIFFSRKTNRFNLICWRLAQEGAQPVECGRI